MSENRRIAKNSLILYIRLLISTVIGLYVSRVVLLQLGLDSFGLFAVVGGLVSMMNFLNSSMTATSNRYIAVELGKKENSNPNQVFNTVLLIHIGLALILIIIAEIFGVWYIKGHLNIEIERIPDALFVLHFSVVSAAIATLSIPFQGLINAYEKFNAKAVIEIIQSLSNLGFVILLTHYVGDKLRAYVIIVTFLVIFSSILYVLYSFVKYKEVVRWKLNRQISDYWKIFKFLGWIMVGVFGSMGAKQGAALLVNLFFGTVINAALGIASTVSDYTWSFVKNLNQAAVPQIIKNHSGGNTERTMTLVYKMSKYTFFIMLIPALPIMLSVGPILKLWLKVVPEFTKQFSILMIIHGLVSCLESGFDATIQATGKIRKSQVLFSIIILSTLPIAYFLFKLGYPPYTITIVLIVAELLFILVQIRILIILTDFKVSQYFSNTIMPILSVVVVIIPLLLIRTLFGEGFFAIVAFSAISVIFIILTIYIIGLSKQERITINNYLSRIKLINKLIIR